MKKGENEFSFYVKGAVGSIIDVTFSFPEYYPKLSPVWLRFPVEDSNWTKFSTSQSISNNKQLIIPDSVSIANIQISCSTYKGGTVKISGMELRKKSTSSILPPWNLTVSQNKLNKIILNWVDNSDNETGFKIGRKIQGEPKYNLLSITPPNVTSFIDSTIFENTNYIYHINAFNTNDESEYSDSVTITPLQSETASIVLKTGWNIFSFPVKPFDFSTNQLFPYAISQIYEYDNDYLPSSNFLLGKGYWFKYANYQKIDLTGIRTPNKVVQLKTGWNLIGLFDKNVVSKNIITNPPNIICSAFYRFETGYYQTDSLNSGYGYWIKAKQDGQLEIDTTQSSSIKTYKDSLKGDWGKIIISDKNNKKFLLFVANEILGKDKYYLPPLPPEGVCDVRWSTNKFVEDNLTGNKEIDIHYADYPVSIKIESMGTQIQDAINGKIINKYFKNGDSLVISDSSVDKILLGNTVLMSQQESVIPSKFELLQNYPNPFNPSTIIGYELPKLSHVVLKVYDIMGREVTTLIDEEKTAGIYKVEMNRKQLSSGVYFYVIHAGNFYQVRKMLLLK